VHVAAYDNVEVSPTPHSDGGPTSAPKSSVVLGVALDDLGISVDREDDRTGPAELAFPFQ
jgi:hypothetical protein